MKKEKKTSTIILASASPRRAELLDQIKVKYHIQAADINEETRLDESFELLVKRLAIKKAEAIVNNNQYEENHPVLGADTLGVIDGQLLTKPRDFDHAHQMLSNMSGNWHEILSAVALSVSSGSSTSANTVVLLNRNRVLFKTLTDNEIIAYWQTGEPQDKAGAYAIQGLAATFIARIEGSYSGIMGLPLFETQQLLDDAGIYSSNFN